MTPVLTQKVQAQIDGLKDMSRDELIALWVKLHGGAPMRGARDVTLIRGTAYALQCKAFVGLKPSTSKQLLKIARGVGLSSSGPRRALEPSSKPRTQIGSQLMREWNGRTYCVIKTDKGFVMNGLTYPSLSAVAKEITGAHWSGPRFFGVQR